MKSRPMKNWKINWDDIQNSYIQNPDRGFYPDRGDFFTHPIEAEEHPYIIGEVYMIDDANEGEGQTMEESQFNARLIEAAPKMYKNILQMAAEDGLQWACDVVSQINGEELTWNQIRGLWEEVDKKS